MTEIIAPITIEQVSINAPINIPTTNISGNLHMDIIEAPVIVQQIDVKAPISVPTTNISGTLLAGQTVVSISEANAYAIACYVAMGGF